VVDEFVERLVELGILATDGDGRFESADVYRTRFVQSCEQAGLPLDGIATAIEAGRVTLAFMNQPQYRWAGMTSTSYRELARETGLSADLLVAVEESFGSPRPEPDDLVRQDVLDRIEILRSGLGMGLTEAVILRLGRVYGDAMRRITEAEGHIWHTYVEGPILQAGMSQIELAQIVGAFGAAITPLQESALVALYRRHQERVWTEDTLEHVEAALEEMGLHRRTERQSAMAFLDVSGYTRLTEERGDLAAAELAATFAELVHGDAQKRAGRVVKWLGDGVMVYFPDPGDAVEATMTMVERIPEAGLPSVHAGIASGPIVVQDGDYFGTTVNLAARVAARAGGGQTLVTDEVARAVARPGVRFREIGRVELKGIVRPVTLHEAVRST
jgi:adenylate cyclase